MLAYGLLIPWLGLYWDDWALTWFSHEYGPSYFINFAPYRPASGWLYYFSFSLLGESVFAWQIYAVLWHWASALAFWWLLKLLWPRVGRVAEAAALIFLVYPGFSQQPIAVTYSLYFLYYTLFLASLVLMVLAQRSTARKLPLTLAALALSAIVMLSTEYFYGLELLRPVLLWLAYNDAKKERARTVFMRWLPYLLVAVGLFGWRYTAAYAAESLYQPFLVSHFIAQPLATIFALIATMLGDFVEAGVLAWTRLVAIWGQLRFPSAALIGYASVALLGGGIAAFAFWPNKKKEAAEASWLRQAAFLGLVALLVSGLSFWLAELPLRLNFPFDRFTLPMAFGIALLAAAGWQALRVHPMAKTLLLAAVIGLTAGYHFFNGNLYREEWDRQQTLFRQLQWRVPGLRPATALLTVELPLEHYTDNSLTAPLNWIYASGDTSTTLPYYLAYLDLREDAELFGQGSGVIRKKYRDSQFVSESGDVLLFLYAPPACLRILDPQLDPYFPQLPGPLADSAARSNLSRILPVGEANTIPYWDANPDGSWCYYFERAELARQQGDWQQVAELGDLAFVLEDAPNHPAERIPFIQGYAMVGEWDKAVRLTAEALEINPLMQPMLCATWAQVADLDAGEGMQAAVEEVNSLLVCNQE